MEDMALQRERKTADRSLFFLSVLLGAICLSWLALDKQRRGLYETGKAPDVTGLRLESSVLVVVALGWFFCQAVKGRGEGRSGAVNFWASLLVLLAALLRLWDLQNPEL